MKGYKKIIFILNLLLFFAVFNWMVAEKEETIKSGTLVLLDLYPLDPRSLMQGDYMRLRYEMTRSWNREKDFASRGYCIVKQGENNIASYERLQSNNTNLAEGEVAIKYYGSSRTIKIGAESFLFEEGQASTYDRAKYGGLRVAENGSAVLVGLYDADGQKIINNYDIE
ncbi:MAG: GDYXXLXY domain-containing protein [Aureispira sp.]|nr:GDYXXLXY domain-containing protein [Aureispira sp.]